MTIKGETENIKVNFVLLAYTVQLYMFQKILLDVVKLTFIHTDSYQKYLLPVNIEKIMIRGSNNWGNIFS